MHDPEKRAGRPSATLAVLIAALVLASAAWLFVLRARLRQAAHPPLPVLGLVPAFSLTDQQGRPVTRESLKGHPFVLDFIFTSCTEFCRDMTARMAGVRSGLGPDCEVRCVSMSVDPDRDTPAVLRTYAAANHADDPRWLFLTGERRVVGVVMQSLHLAPSGDPAHLSTVQHSSRLVLVDGDSRVRGFYAYDDAEARQRLVDDARALEAAGP